jgi:hypothetical protein
VKFCPHSTIAKFSLVSTMPEEIFQWAIMKFVCKHLVWVLELAKSFSKFSKDEREIMMREYMKVLMLIVR